MIPKSIISKIRAVQKQGSREVFTLRPHIDWISLGIALFLGLLARYANFHIPW